MVSRSESARVLLTGASGFTGRYVAAALEEAGYTVLDAEAAGVGFDLTQPATVASVLETTRPDYVIHLAALSFVGLQDAAAFYAVNTVGTANLLEALAARAERPRRVVLASSANVYGNARVEPITEDTAPAPVNHYAASKLAMEAMAHTYADRLPLVMTRPFNYTGRGQTESFLVPKLVAHFARRAPAIELGNLDVVRDFSDVRSVAQAYVRLLTAEVDGDVVNLCSGTGRSLRWIVDQLTQLSGHHIDIRTNPAFVRASEVHRLVGSAQRMQRALGVLPHQDFRETLHWMLHAVPAAAAAH